MAARRWVARRVALTGAVALVLGLLTLAPTASAGVTVRPGDALYVQVDANTSSQCTANFVFANRTATFIGLAAHCFPTPATQETDTNGCTAPTQGGQPAVSDAAGDVIGHRVYSSWVTMQGAHPTPAQVAGEMCQYNDLALVQLGPGVAADPSVPHWGGPTGLAPGDAMAGAPVYSYGNSDLRLGISALSPKQGYGVDDSPEGWSHDVYTATPGVPGDSGSGFLDGQGRAFGILSSVAIAPLPASNGVGDLARELAFADFIGHMGAHVVTGPAFYG